MAECIARTTTDAWQHSLSAERCDRQDVPVRCSLLMLNFKEC